jgi:hypothetical protein
MVAIGVQSSCCHHDVYKTEVATLHVSIMPPKKKRSSPAAKKPAKSTCNFATLLLLAFYEYKKKSCSLFARSFSMMLVAFDQVCRA